MSIEQKNDLADHDEKAAARILGVAPRTLRRWRLAGRIDHYRMPGNRVRYSVEQLLAAQRNVRGDGSP